MADSPKIVQQKQVCRKRQSLLRKQVRSGLTSDVFDTIAEKIISVINEANLQNPVVSGFFPIGSEVDVRPALELALQNDFEICLPCIVAKNEPLIFRKWRSGDDLIVEEFGTQAPQASAEQLTPNVIITPLLAFDKRGYRLGYGGGFYDRTIAKYNQLNHKFITLGVGLDMQRIDSVPIGVYDEPLNFVITEQNIYRN